MSEPQFDERFDALLSMLESIASLDFTRKLKLSSKADKIDAVAAGLKDANRYKGRKVAVVVCGRNITLDKFIYAIEQA